MRAIIDILPDTIFIKTKKGKEEINQRGAGLTLAQRRVLIIVDGSRSFSEIRQMALALIEAGEFREIFSLLRRKGLILSSQDEAERPALALLETAATAERRPDEEVVHRAKPALALAGADAEAALVADPAALRQIKDFMATTAYTYLGLLSAEVVQPIERARDAAQLLSIAGHWHMALRGSKYGCRFADMYVDQVKQALTGARPVAEIMRAIEA